jgi:hypothetical protein
MQAQTTAYVMRYTNRTGYRAEHYVFVSDSRLHLEQLLALSDNASERHGFTSISFARPRS